MQDNLTNPSNPRCAFWNFSLIQEGYVAFCINFKLHLAIVLTLSGIGGWDFTNVTTDDIDNLTIRCNTTHLTSFAVLVDVSGQSTRVIIMQKFNVVCFTIQHFRVKLKVPPYL